MLKVLTAVLIVIAGIAIYIFSASISYVEVTIPDKQYFGKGKEHTDDASIRKFKVTVADVVLDDLKSRLQRSRVSHEQLEDVPDFEYGFNRKTLDRFANYWATKYDWRKHEDILNAFPQFTTEIEGLKIHFLHVKPPAGKYAKVIPIILVHGWPGNVFEFYKFIPFLTDPKTHLGQTFTDDIAFEVVAPSIPGYGWSEAPHKRGFSQVASARIFHKLMTQRLAFPKYIAHGGDWGHINIMHMARVFPNSIYGVHGVTPFLKLDAPRNILHALVGSVLPNLVYSNPEQSFKWSLKKAFLDVMKESGYLHLQATRPDTVGVALNDSPIGLMAYILEKFSTWTNPKFRFTPDGGLEKKFTMDELLTVVTIYWVNGNILNSQRYYREFFIDENNALLEQKYVSVPVGILAAPHDLMERPPHDLIAWRYNLTHYNELDDGGHFTSFEMPKEVAADVFKFAKTLKI